MTVPETTLTQLGGAGRLSVMIGAHHFTQSERVLSFKFKARAKNGSNHIRIKLEDDDTYTVTFFSLRGLSVKDKGTLHGVYCDSLKRVIESATGLYLSV